MNFWVDKQLAVKVDFWVNYFVLLKGKVGDVDVKNALN